MTSYEIIILPEAEEDLDRLDPPVGRRCLEKIQWLSSHPELLGKKPLHNLPHDLKGLNSYTMGNWRILYWVYPQPGILKIYGIEHRSKVYRPF